MNIIFRTVSMQNFLSYGNVTSVVQLDKPGTTLITGEDLDNTTNGKTANGVGKSTIINAIVFALYDKTIDDISKDNLINNVNKRNLEVSVVFDIGSITYTVTRTRKSAGSGAVKIEERVGDVVKDVTPSGDDANKKIAELLNLPFELFVRIVIFSASHKPFLSLPSRSTTTTANQSDIIEELFGLTMLSRKADLLKERIKENEQAFKSGAAELSLIEQERKRHQQQIESMHAKIADWDVKRAATVIELQGRLDAVDQIDVAAEQLKHNALAKINSTISTTKSEFNLYKSQTKTLMVKLNDLDSSIESLSKSQCPFCHQSYHDEYKLNAMRTERDELIATSETNEVRLSELSELLTSLESNKLSTAAQIGSVNITELVKLSSQKDVMAAKIDDLLAAQNPHSDTLQELTEMTIPEADYTTVNKLEVEIEHQKFLHKLLTKKDSFVRKSLLNKNIPFLNTRLQQFLAVLGLPHKIEFTQEMTASISRFGQELNFGNLSAGQKARVNIALAFAFRDVLQHMHTGINICVLDEVLDSALDTVGIQSAAKLLKHKAREDSLSVFVITHRSDIECAFDREITIQLKDGFSYVLDNIGDN